MFPPQGTGVVVVRDVGRVGVDSVAGEAGATEEDEGEGGGNTVGEEEVITEEGVVVGVDEEERARGEDNKCLPCVGG